MAGRKITRQLWAASRTGCPFSDFAPPVRSQSERTILKQNKILLIYVDVGLHFIRSHYFPFFLLFCNDETHQCSSGPLRFLAIACRSSSPRRASSHEKHCPAAVLAQKTKKATQKRPGLLEHLLEWRGGRARSTTTQRRRRRRRRLRWVRGLWRRRWRRGGAVSTGASQT